MGSQSGMATDRPTTFRLFVRIYITTNTFHIRWYTKSELMGLGLGYFNDTWSQERHSVSCMTIIF